MALSMRKNRYICRESTVFAGPILYIDRAQGCHPHRKKTIYQPFYLLLCAPHTPQREKTTRVNIYYRPTTVTGGHGNLSMSSASCTWRPVDSYNWSCALFPIHIFLSDIRMDKKPGPSGNAASGTE